MAKTNSGLGGVAIFLGLVAAGALALPREFGMALWVIAVVVIAVYLYRKIPEATPPTANPPKNKIRRPVVPKQPQPRAAQFSPPPQPKPAPRREDAPTLVAPRSSPPPSYSVPPPPKGFGQATWVPKGQPISVRGLIIPGGMLYFGRSLKTLSNENDPSLIDPSKSLSGQGDFTVRQTDYWPNYSTISASARSAYLNWLADGKKHPEADIGYVFLYFYGLERRAIIDLSTETGVREDLPGILQELRRLVDIYGAKSSSFSRYANGLINWVELADPPANLYERDIPEFARTCEVPVYIRLALGEAALDGVPLPANLALGWVRLDPNFKLRTPAIRCEKEFAILFKMKYAQAFGTGMLLPKNKTKLKLVYRAASPAFQSYTGIELSFGETPDVTVLTGPVNKLRILVDAATLELEGYSRYLGRIASNVAQADGKVSPAEVRMLEKVYKALGVEPKKVYSDLHAGASGTVATQAAPAKAEGFKLDAVRIASLQKESEKVSALLAGIFKEEEPAVVATAEPVVAERADEASPVEGLLGLDEAHSSFVRMLLSRPQWSRAELLDVAGDLELMLDGALEHINEASFDRYDTALTEGDDPVEVRADVMEKLEA